MTELPRLTPDETVPAALWGVVRWMDRFGHEHPDLTEDEREKFQAAWLLIAQAADLLSPTG